MNWALGERLLRVRAHLRQRLLHERPKQGELRRVLLVELQPGDGLHAPLQERQRALDAGRLE